MFLFFISHGCTLHYRLPTFEVESGEDKEILLELQSYIPIVKQSLQWQKIYVTTSANASDLHRQIEQITASKTVRFGRIDEKIVRLHINFPFELGHSDYQQQHYVMNYTPLWVQLESLQKQRPKKLLKIALINGLGSALGDSLVGLTALRMVKKYCLRYFEQVEFHALLRADRFTDLYLLYKNSHLFAQINALPCNAETLFSYDAFFDFSGLAHKAVDALNTMPMIDFFLYCFGIPPSIIPAIAKRNCLTLPISIQQTIDVALLPLQTLKKQKNIELVLFHPTASASVRSIPVEQQQRLLIELLSNVQVHVICALALTETLEHPYLKHHSRLHRFAEVSHSILHLAALLLRMDKLICVDTVIYHLADALDIASVVCFSTIPPHLRISYYPTIQGVLLRDAEKTAYFGRHINDKNIPTTEVSRLWEKLSAQEIWQAFQQIVCNKHSQHRYQQWLETALYYEQEQYNDIAHYYFQQILNEQTENIGALHGLARLAIRQKQYLTAIYFLQKAIQVQPQPIFYHTLAQLYLQKKQIVLARQTLQQILQYYPFDSKAKQELQKLTVEKEK